MSFGSRVADTSNFNSASNRENYSSITKTPGSANQRLEQIRKKYDTPTRRQIKEINNRPPTDRNQNSDLKKSDPNVGLLESRWAYRDGKIDTNNMAKDYNMSPMYQKENLKSEQEAVFRKIKELKNSLLTKNYDDKIKTTKSIYQPSANQRNESRPNILNQHRVQSIDKINSKIQHILSCLRQTEPKNSIIYDSNSKKDAVDSSKVTADRSYYRKTPQDSKCTIETRPEVKNTSSVYQKDKNYGAESPVAKPLEAFSISGRRQGSRARSFISSVQKETYEDSKYEMKNGRKLDDEITKIQNKIQQFQEQKRRLNIEFTPYSHSQSKSSSNLLKRSYTIDKYQRPASKLTEQKPQPARNEKPALIQERSSDMKSSFEAKYNRYSLRQRQAYKEKPKEANKNIETSEINVEISRASQNYGSGNESSLFQIKLIPVEQEQPSSRRATMLSDELRKKTDEGILDRRKRLAYQTNTKAKPGVRKLVQKLKMQAVVDQKFRNCKIWFESSTDVNKWERLQDSLYRNGLKLSRQQTRSIFKVTDEQNNPFFSISDCSGGSIEDLVSAYLESSKCWASGDSYSVTKQQLLKDDFSNQSLDLQKKGYIVLQDLVRFLNMETGTFYRNRDIYLIFRRVTTNDKVSFAELLAKLCK